MKVETQRVRMLSSDSAVVTGAYSFGRTDRPNARPWPAYFVITLARSDGQWFVSTQATLAVPEPWAPALKSAGPAAIPGRRPAVTAP